jgi:hypothetical protein
MMKTKINIWGNNMKHIKKLAVMLTLALILPLLSGLAVTASAEYDAVSGATSKQPEPEPFYKIERSSQSVSVDGKDTAFEVYNIDGANYFKLRDIAFVLNGTGSQFSVGYDDVSKLVTCTTGTDYTPDGSELKTGADKSDTAVPSTQSLLINGTAGNLTAFNIGGNNFYKLRELGDALGFTVDYDDATRTVLIKSLKKPAP